MGQSRWRRKRRGGGRGGGDDRRAYLQLPEYLRLSAGLQVLQSLGPEAVILVQGAMATRGADESMTTQEPEHESSPAGLEAGVPQTRGSMGNAVFWAARWRIPLKTSQDHIEGFYC